MLSDDKNTPLQLHLHNILQILCYITPLNDWDDDENAFICPITNSIISNKEIYFHSSGYILDRGSFIENNDEFNIFMKENHFSEFEMLTFQLNFTRDNESSEVIKFLQLILRRSTLDHFMAWSSLLVLIWQYGQCVRDPDYRVYDYFYTRFIHNIQSLIDFSEYLPSIFTFSNRFTQCISPAV